MKSKFISVFILIMVFVVQSSFAQQRTITGKVTDESGLELPGVSVVVKGTARGAQSDFDGNYTIRVNDGETLVFTYLGQRSEERTVGGSDVINIQMTEGAEALEEVVVIAYGQQSRKKLVQSVSIIGNESIRDIPALSPQELLQGQASGVQVVNSSGILGAAPVISIRGVNSITSGTRPLIVVDGVPMNDANLSAGQGGQALNPLGDINPNDIESFSVLKDAAATAVYGSRGSNGVILITTKSGKKNQKTSIIINTNISWTERTALIDMMNADQFRQFRIDNGTIDPMVDPPDPEGSFDWPSNVVRTGFSQNIDFSIRGGSEKTTFSVGATFRDQEGYIIGNNLKRTSARINLGHDATDWLKFGVNLGITENLNNRVGSENSTFAPLTSSFLQTPWVEPYDANGNYVNTGFIANVLAIEDLDINDSNSFRTVGNVYAQLDFSSLVDGLSFRSDFGIDRVLLEEFQRSFEINSPGGTASDFYAQQNKYVFTNTLNYSRNFNNVHDLSAIVGLAYEQTDIRTITISGTGFLSDNQINVSSAATPITSGNTTRGNRLTGYFGRFNYSYNDKYIVEGSLRRDGSSRFGADFRFGTFWSVGGAWIISDEDFMQDVSWMNSLKLRANYGVAGNDRIGDFSALESFGNNGTPAIANYNGAAGLRQLSPANPELRWERAKSYDIGFEASLFNNRVTLAVDYYNKRTDDLILNFPIPATNGGVNSITRNVGEMENKGVDIDITTENYKTTDFSWTTTFNFNYNTNKVLSLPGANLDNQGRYFVPATTSQRAVEGYSVNSFFLIRYLGVNPDTGDAEWMDIDGNPTTAPTTDDRVIAGKANPDFVGGLRNTLTYKDWDLNFFFNFSYGNDIFVSGLRFTDNPSGTFNKRAALLDVWENPGDNAFAPAYSSATFSSTFSQRSTAQLKDGSYARLKNLTVGYTMPERFLESLGFVQGIRLYFTANNLFTIKASDLEGIDPEVTGSIAANIQGETFFTPPQSKTYLIGARLTF